MAVRRTAGVADRRAAQVVQLVYATLGALIFSMYLLFDTQLMMGGHKKYALSPEVCARRLHSASAAPAPHPEALWQEYVFAALSLYVDVINLFLYILQLVSAARR